MKKLLFLAFVLVTCYLKVMAQVPFNTMDSIDINNINASVLVHGDMWWNPELGVSACKFPNGTNKPINFAGSLWMSAYDSSGTLHVSAQTYRQAGNDYWPGPLDSSDTLTYAMATNWAKIWKVNRTDIVYFLLLGTHTLINTPQAILTWPAKGNVNAQGNGGIPLSISTEMAPFIDLNGNGIYEPLLGEYPDIKGDQALWWVFSDNGPTHNQSNGRPLGMEIHASSYAYNRGTLIDNVVYYEYTMINKSVNNYEKMRLAIWDDIDLGYVSDDYIGFDSTWRMGICYNGTDCDGCSAGWPANSYGSYPPQSAITLIVLPGDASPVYVPAGSFTTYNNDFSITGNPNNDIACNNYMRSRLANGKTIAHNYSSGTLPCGGYDSTATINYLFPGNPSDSSAWSECICGNTPGDRRFILSSNDFLLHAGTSQKVVFAHLVADSAGGCPSTNFNKIRIVADTAWGNYRQNASGVKNIVPINYINIYPNPAHSQLFIENTMANQNNETITIYNIIGQEVNVPIIKSGRKSVADIGSLRAGMYLVFYSNGTVQKTTRFIKE